jgi:hypothetical protein
MRVTRGAAVAAAALAAAVAAVAEDSSDVIARMHALRPARPYVVLRRFVCAASGTSAADLEHDLAEARAVFAACRLDLRAEAAQTIASDYGPSAPCGLGDDRDSKTLTSDQLALFARYNRPADGISVFYLSSREGPDGPTTAGTSFPADFLRTAKAGSADAPRAAGAVVVFSEARHFTGKPYVLAHELGHVLLDDAFHRKEKDNLMHGWDGGRRLDEAQCLTIRASPFVRREEAPPR